MNLGTLRPYMDARIATLPMLTLHVTESCDSRCIGCSYGARPGPRLSSATAAELASVADDLDTRVVLITGGEPLILPDLGELVRPFVKDGRRIYLATSGTRLAERASLVAALFDEVFVSLDGPDAATHDAIRGVPTFAALAAGIAALRSFAPRPVTARMTVQRRNVDRIAETARTARRIAIDRISFLAVDAWSGAFGRAGTEQLSGLLPTSAQLRDLVTSMAAIEEELGPELVPNLEHVVRQLRAALGEIPSPSKRCNTPLMSAVVDGDGSVRPCFFKAPMGHLRDGGLRAVLDSPAAVKLRANLDTARDPDCQRCVCPKYFPLRELLRGRIR